MLSEPNTKVQVFSLALAIWGAMLSTILAALKIAEFTRDKVDLRVTFRGGYAIYPETAVTRNKTYIMIKASNRGRRPVTIESSSAGLMIPWSKLSANVSPFGQFGQPVTTLAEGQSYSYYIDETEFKKKSKKDVGDCIAYVYDQTGRMFYSCGLFNRLIKGRLR